MLGSQAGATAHGLRMCFVLFCFVVLEISVVPHWEKIAVKTDHLSPSVLITIGSVCAADGQGRGEGYLRSGLALAFPEAGPYPLAAHLPRCFLHTLPLRRKFESPGVSNFSFKRERATANTLVLA